MLAQAAAAWPELERQLARLANVLAIHQRRLRSRLVDAGANE
jgi:hypothetical protein